MEELLLGVMRAGQQELLRTGRDREGRSASAAASA